MVIGVNDFLNAICIATVIFELLFITIIQFIDLVKDIKETERRKKDNEE